MNNSTFDPASHSEILQSISDEALIEEIARRMDAAPVFYEKTCNHKRLQSSVERAHYRMEAAAHRMNEAA